MKPTSTSVTSHKLKTFLASIFGIIAVYLIIASVSVVWLNQTLTNSNVYVKTVTPLISKPAIQKFIAEKVTQQITKQTSLQNLASTLLPSGNLSTQQNAALQQQVNNLIEQNVINIVQTPSFAALWKTTNQTAHAELLKQLNNPNLSSLTINLSPSVNAVLNDLNTTPLASVVSQINLSPTDGVINIKSNNLNRLHQYYEWFKEGTIAIVCLAIIAIAASILLSVNHYKTARRILLVSGIVLILQGLLLEAPALINISGNDPVTQAAAKAFVEVLVHNLQLASLVIGAVFVLVALGSKLYSKFKKNKN